MGRKRKSLVEKSPFKLRRRKLADGRMSLFLDRSVDGGHEYEFLQLYLLPETSSTTKRQNARTLREAEEILQARTEALLNAKAETELAGSSGDMLLSDWLQTSYDNHEKRGLRDMGSISNVKRALHMFRPDTRLSDIDRQFCLDMIDWLRNTYRHRRTGNPVSARTADTYCQTFRTMLNEAVREGLIDKNPWNRLETAEKIKKPESKREYLTIDEIRSMIATDCPNELVKRAYLFSCFTGLRISDVRNLKWGDVCHENGQTFVSVVMKKTTKPLYIPLSGQALKWMPEQDGSESDDHVFGNLVNYGNVNENLKKWAEAAGIRKHISYHTSRHSFATMMLTLGADLYTVSKLLGHSSVRHTQIYARIIDRKKDEAVNLADSVF
ncbi:site-specific integrase [Bacteroides fragilis]|uniref:site-specific integrase n=1 Tax=Bacteroides fragilis TaxID=817 RepID=UPI0015F76D73|nr:site-specific integrase [Bacteroides fragilis]MBA5654103.1 site-specific integrase [Bacteroides fragilis]